MASYDQMVTHYRMVGEQRAAEEEARRQAAQQAAALQSQRDAELADIQRRQQFQQADLQSQLTAQQAGYQQQRDVLGAGLQERRDYLGNAIQQDQMRLGAGIQSQRDQQLSGQRMQEAEHGASLQAQLSQAQLNQQEQMRMRRLEMSISHTDQQVANGFLSPEEGAAYKTELVTNINPLRNRAMEADRLRTVMQTQQIEQQNAHQAQLFADRQARMAAGAEGNLRRVWNEDTQRFDRYMVDINTGALNPLESSSLEQARQMHLLQAGQSMQQSAQLFPGQLQAQEAGIAAQRAGTEAALSGIRRAEAMQPGQLALLNQAVQQGPQAFQNEQAYQQARTSLLQQQVDQGPQAFQSQQAYQQAQTELLRQNVAQGPQAFQSEQAYRAAQTQLVNAQVAEMPRVAQMRQQLQDGQITRLQVENEQTRAQTALTQMQVDGGLPPAVAMHAYESIARAIDTELNNPVSAVSTRIARLPAGEQAAAADAYRNTEMQRRIEEIQRVFPSMTRPRQGNAPAPAPGPAPVQMQNFRQEMNAAANQNIPRIPLAQQREQMPQTISPETTRRIATTATEVYNSLSLFDRAVHYTTLGRLADLTRAAAQENRELTPQERAEVARLLDGIQSSDPRVAERLRSQLPGFSRNNVANPLQNNPPITEGVTGF